MRTTVWGHSGQPGGVTPGASVSTGDHLVLVSSRGGGPINAVSLRLEPNEERVDHVWVRELPYAPDRAAGYSEGAPIPFVVAATEGLVYLVSGSGRALTAAASGGVVAETSAPGRPSALPLVVGPELLVPEGPELAAYDAATLVPRWRRPTPRGLRARPPSMACARSTLRADRRANLRSSPCGTSTAAALSRHARAKLVCARTARWPRQR